MPDRDDVKRRIEDATLVYFLRAYGPLMSREYRVVERRERPDAVIEDTTGERLGVELTTLGYVYGAGDLFVPRGLHSDVQMLLGRSPTDLSGTQVHFSLLAELNRLLEQKRSIFTGVEVPYPLVLVVRSASPLYFADTFELWREHIVAPAGPFREQWLVVHPEEGAQLRPWGHLMRLDTPR